MKELWSTYKKDLKLAIRSFYIYVVLFFAFIYIFVMHFAVPENTDSNFEVLAGEGFVALSDEVKGVINESDMDENLTIVESREAILDELEHDRTATGVYYDLVDGKLQIEYIMQGFEGDTTRAMTKQITESEFAKSVDPSLEVNVTYLKGKNAESMSLASMMTPIFVVMESALMGMFLVAAYIFMEKNEGTVKAYLVSPAKTLTYIGAKVMMFVTFGLVSAVLSALLVNGFTFNILTFSLSIAVFSVFGTLLGVFLAAFFDNIQGAMLWIVVIAGIFAVSTVSYSMPSFSPVFIRYLPTYPMQFALRDILTGLGNSAYVWQNIFLFLGLDVLLLGLTTTVYSRRVSSF